MHKQNLPESIVSLGFQENEPVNEFTSRMVSRQEWDIMWAKWDSRLGHTRLKMHAHICVRSRK